MDIAQIIIIVSGSMACLFCCCSNYLCFKESTSTYCTSSTNRHINNDVVVNMDNSSNSTSNAYNGLKVQLLDEMEMITFISNDVCAICYDEDHIYDLVKLFSCGHIFHKECIVDWYEKDTKENLHCPLCQKKFIFTLDV